MQLNSTKIQPARGGNNIHKASERTIIAQPISLLPMKKLSFIHTALNFRYLLKGSLTQLMYFCSGGQRDNRLRRRRPPSKAGMRPLSVAVFNPAFRQHLRLIHIPQEFFVEKFIPHAGIKTFDISVFPWASRFNISRNHAGFAVPFPHFDWAELAHVIAAKIFRCAVQKY